jgi:putative membrane protein
MTDEPGDLLAEHETLLPAPRTPARLPAAVAAQVARGFSMGTADMVPGVSGGTIALVLGIYHDLVAVVRDGSAVLARSVRLDLRGGWEQLRRVDWLFLVPLLTGVGLAVAVLAGPLATLLEERPVQMSAVFFGLIVGSIVVALDEVGRWDATRAGLLVVVALLTFALLGLRGPAIARPGLPLVLAGGALASTAMILPGISGSFVLLMIGLYQAVLEAVHDRDVVVLAALAAGAAAGLAVFSTTLNWLLERHRDTVMAALIGVMAGSLRVLWMWPADGIGDTRLGRPVPAQVPGVVLAAVAAAVAVVVLARLARVRRRTSE